ncbi:NRPS-like protein [Pseudogymnoascus sp. 24MN13]|nr:NRPS-like protein [Pseudogymnoascus sp. 24MN13]
MAADIAHSSTTQHISSQSFLSPVDTSLVYSRRQRTFTTNHVPHTIDELMRLRAFHQPEEPILAYPVHNTDYLEYTYRELDMFAYRVGQQYVQHTTQRRSSAEKEKVVALLGPSNLDYLISVLALTKSGFTVMFLSTRLSDAAYLSLLESTQCRDIIIHESFSTTAERLRKTMPDLSAYPIAQPASYAFTTRENDQDTCLDYHLDLELEAQKICWIIHSSGSTGLPKPIFQTHKAALTNYENNLNMRGFITLPLFHAHGISSVFRAFTSMKKIYMYNANLPLTHNTLLSIMAEHSFEILYGVPYALKLLGETEEGIKALVKLQVVMFGGSACPDSLGDRLVGAGVNLISHYGTTETGQLMTSFRDRSDKVWNYLRPSATLIPFLRWESRGLDLFELVVLDGWPSKVATNRSDGSYATKDLFTPHPSIPNAWKYSARLDDTIALLNGEKVGPTDMEQAIRDNKYVREAVVFGNGRPQLGMMIIPSKETAGMPESRILEHIWPVVEASNAAAPGYARVSVEMLKLLPASSTYPQTDKGTVIRQAFYKLFEKEIEDVYSTSELSPSTNAPSTEPEIRAFLKEKICTLNGQGELDDDTDLFSVGLDSLQALQLRSLILKKLPVSGKVLAMNFVFDFPSVNALTRGLVLLQDGQTSKSIPVQEQMAQLIEKYGSFQHHIPKPNSNEGQYIVLTGATGSLGAHIIAQIVLLPDVKQVYCFVRAKSESDAITRVISSMNTRGCYHQLPLEARRKIVALPSDFSKEDLGLGSAVYAEIALNITCLIHCAWSVNFNLSLQSFEKDCIAGAKHLMGLCLSAGRPSPAAFNFCSSVSAVASTPPGEAVVEDLPPNLDYAQNMGYAQSKLVTENIVHQAACQTGMKARTLRVGQIVADTQHGIWNATEAIPLILQAGKTIGAIPALDESPLWLPVDVVAKAISEISISDSPAGTTNVVATQSFHWTRDLIPKLHAASLQFEELGQREWISRLKASNPDPVQNPPIKLLDFFTKKYDNDNIVRKGLQYNTQRAQSLSPARATAEILSQELVDKFVGHFITTSWKPTEKIQGTIIVVAGPCGAGKSTVGTEIARKLNCSFIEGDQHHDVQALAKMASGQALDDEDRWLWLARLRAEAELEISTNGKGVVVLACSALKGRYRDVLRGVGKRIRTVFVMLQVDKKVELARRLEMRTGHYMKADMVESQMAILEGPRVDEIDILPVDAKNMPQDLAEEVFGVLGL